MGCSVCCFVYSSILKMKTVCSSETSEHSTSLHGVIFHKIVFFNFKTRCMIIILDIFHLSEVRYHRPYITRNYEIDFTHLNMHIKPTSEISCRLCHIYPTLDTYTLFITNQPLSKL
jgi:hypothetical protein